MPRITKAPNLYTGAQLPPPPAVVVSAPAPAPAPPPRAPTSVVPRNSGTSFVLAGPAKTTSAPPGTASTAPPTTTPAAAAPQVGPSQVLSSSASLKKNGLIGFTGVAPAVAAATTFSVVPGPQPTGAFTFSVPAPATSAPAVVSAAVAASAAPAPAVPPPASAPDPIPAQLSPAELAKWWASVPAAPPALPALFDCRSCGVPSVYPAHCAFSAWMRGEAAPIEWHVYSGQVAPADFRMDFCFDWSPANNFAPGMDWEFC